MSEASDIEIEEYRKEYSEQMRRGFEGYRQAGIGLSATIISLDMLLLWRVLEGPVPGAVASTVFYCKFFLSLSIFGALIIQVFNYFGSRDQADTYRKLKDHFRLRQVELTQESKDKTRAAWVRGAMFSYNANRHFARADRAVEASLATLFIGFFAWIFVTPFFF